MNFIGYKHMKTLSNKILCEFFDVHDFIHVRFVIIKPSNNLGREYTCSRCGKQNLIDYEI